MGPSITTLVTDSPRSRHAIPYEEARSIAKQLLQGLDCLHQRQIAYSDMNFGNLLRTLESSWLENSQDIDQSPGFPRDVAAPPYMHSAHPLTEFVDNYAAPKIKLSDLGAAFPFSSPPEKPVVPLALRAPEIILGCDLDHRIDIWSFGCLVFEILTGSQLFGVYPLPFMKDAQIDDQHLIDIVGALGKMPSELVSHWSRGSGYFDSDMELVRSDAGEDDIPQGELYQAPSLEMRFMERKPPEMSAEETKLVLSFLQRCLQYDSAKRATTAELLEDPWIQSIVEDF
jgi:serine/threonine protein kinase